jgi:hypothetical protein
MEKQDVMECYMRSEGANLINLSPIRNLLSVKVRSRSEFHRLRKGGGTHGKQEG